MKILFIASTASNHAIKWVNTLSNRGHEIILISRSDQKDNNNFINKKVTIKYFKPYHKLGYYLNVPFVKKIFKKFKPDVVNVHYASGFGLLARLSKCRPLVLSVYGSDIYLYSEKSKFYKKTIKKNLLYADAIASTSIVMANETKKILNNKDIDITVTPFGVDINKFSPQKRKESTSIVIGFIKYLEPIYDVHLLIEAFYYVLKNTNLDVMLHIYGNGSQKSKLIKYTEELGIANKVVFNNTIPNYEVPNILNTFDIFVNCSLKESFGVNIVEAMACALPVVATNCVGPKEIIDDGINGIILKDRSPENFAHELIKLINDKNLREKMGIEGRKKVIEMYDWEKNVDIMEKLYHNTVLDYDNRKNKKNH